MWTGLAGKRIVLTRPKDQSGDEMELLENYGAEIISLPCIKIVPVRDYSLIDSKMETTCFDFIVFPSANSVEMFTTRLNSQKKRKCLERAKIIAVGPKTKEKCRSLELPVDLIPKTYNARGVITLLQEMDITDKNIMVPASTISRTELSDGLEKLGANVFVLPVYDIVLPDKEEISEEIDKVKNKVPDLFIFTSPSTFENCLKILEVKDPKLFFDNTKIAAIGTTTRETIENKGLSVDIMPESFTMKALVEKIVEFYKT